jgi:HEPN domain-containing protein
MKRERFPADDPREWINRATSNLIRARLINPDVLFEDLCFDAQQCAEKAIKGLFVLRGERFPLIHDLEELLQRLTRIGVKVPKYVWDADELSHFAVQTRYPGMADPVTKREYRRAVRIAEAVLRWAERQVEAAVKKREGKK